VSRSRNNGQVGVHFGVFVFAAFDPAERIFSAHFAPAPSAKAIWIGYRGKLADPCPVLSTALTTGAWPSSVSASFIKTFRRVSLVSRSARAR